MAKAQAPPKTRFTWRRAAAVLFALAVIVAFAFFQDEVRKYQELGYLGLFLINLMGSGTIILPVPALLSVYLAGETLNPWLVGVVSGAASAIGELTGYLLGFGGGVLIDENPVYQKFYDFMKRYGFWTILVLAIIPNPLFDMAGMAAGALRFPVSRFLIAAFIGKTVRMIAVAYAGYYSLGFVRDFISGG
ncbi:MAG: VTT domain-containing protein [Chloroflexi bacterium]|nr:VTT domain-containing protein [Chloroflexota bacterium]